MDASWIYTYYHPFPLYDCLPMLFLRHVFGIEREHVFDRSKAALVILEARAVRCGDVEARFLQFGEEDLLRKGLVVLKRKRVEACDELGIVKTCITEVNGSAHV